MLRRGIAGTRGESNVRKQEGVLFQWIIGFLMWTRTGTGWKLDWNRLTEVLNFRMRGGVWNLLSTDFCPESLLFFF